MLTFLTTPMKSCAASNDEQIEDNYDNLLLCCCRSLRMFQRVRNSGRTAFLSFSFSRTRFVEYYYPTIRDPSVLTSLTTPMKAFTASNDEQIDDSLSSLELVSE